MFCKTTHAIYICMITNRSLSELDELIVIDIFVYTIYCFVSCCYKYVLENKTYFQLNIINTICNLVYYSLYPISFFYLEFSSLSYKYFSFFASLGI